MTPLRTIDCHTHILTEETIGLLGKEAPTIAPKLTSIDGDNAILEIAGTPYRPFPRGGFDVERRFKDMDAAEVDVHVLSATPQTYLYDKDASLAVTTSALQNADELRRVAHTHGLRGAMIGSNIAGKNLDDRSFEPVWAAAAELGAFMLIHPNNVAGANRLGSYYLNNLIGNPLDTTIAAACLVFGGVLERHPRLNVLLVHGGGFVPYQAGRWVHGWHVRPEPKVNIKRSPEPWLDRFYYDTILHARPQLEFLVSSVGSGRVLLGSDYPYDMGTGECVRQVKALSASDAVKETVLSGLATKLLTVKAG
jgi:aminocarboxymuconate-semialdehyde decarboxylase